MPVSPSIKKLQGAVKKVQMQQRVVTQIRASQAATLHKAQVGALTAHMMYDVQKLVGANLKSKVLFLNKHSIKRSLRSTYRDIKNNKRKFILTAASLAVTGALTGGIAVGIAAGVKVAVYFIKALITWGRKSWKKKRVNNSKAAGMSVVSRYENGFLEVNDDFGMLIDDIKYLVENGGLREIADAYAFIYDDYKALNRQGVVDPNIIDPKRSYNMVGGPQALSFSKNFTNCDEAAGTWMSLCRIYYRYMELSEAFSLLDDFVYFIMLEHSKSAHREQQEFSRLWGVITAAHPTAEGLMKFLNDIVNSAGIREHFGRVFFKRKKDYLGWIYKMLPERLTTGVRGDLNGTAFRLKLYMLKYSQDPQYDVVMMQLAALHDAQLARRPKTLAEVAKATKQKLCQELVTEIENWRRATGKTNAAVLALGMGMNVGAGPSRGMAGHAQVASKFQNAGTISVKEKTTFGDRMAHVGGLGKDIVVDSGSDVITGNYLSLIDAPVNWAGSMLKDHLKGEFENVGASTGSYLKGPWEFNSAEFDARVDSIQGIVEAAVSAIVEIGNKAWEKWQQETGRTFGMSGFRDQTREERVTNFKNLASGSLGDYIKTVQGLHKAMKQMRTAASPEAAAGALLSYRVLDVEFFGSDLNHMFEMVITDCDYYYQSVKKLMTNEVSASISRFIDQHPPNNCMGMCCYQSMAAIMPDLIEGMDLTSIQAIRHFPVQPVNGPNNVDTYIKKAAKKK